MLYPRVVLYLIHRFQRIILLNSSAYEFQVKNFVFLEFTDIFPNL